MSLDYYYSFLVEETQIPVLRFYGWKPFCLSLGRHQTTEVINRNMVREKKVETVRRPTGGSAIYHANELTYSFIIPKSEMSHQQMYYMFHYILSAALNELGIRVSLSNIEKPGSYLNQGKETFACFNRAAKSEIQFKGKKVVGSAQKIYKNTILQHGSILIGKEHNDILSFLQLKEKEREEQNNYLSSNSISLNEISTYPFTKVQIAENIVKKLADFNHLNKIFYKYTESNEQFEANKHRNEFSI